MHHLLTVLPNRNEQHPVFSRGVEPHALLVPLQGQGGQELIPADIWRTDGLRAWTARRSVNRADTWRQTSIHTRIDLELLTPHVFRQWEEAGAGEGKPTQEVKLTKKKK